MPSERRLAAIMFTDIVGYTALMGRDEHAAFELLAENRAIQKPLIENFNGKWIKELGDGVMATFSTATDAVHCAALILQKVSDIAGLELRIGIHLGEIVEENKDVFGDGVNIAARLQSAAPVGGIYISDTVQKNISNKRGIETSFISEISLKNVKDPVQVYEVKVGALESISFPSGQHAKHGTTPQKSIAILPFVNMSGDPEQEYFSDGMAEEILISLGNIKDLKVVSRTSSFQFKGKQIDIRSIGQQLEVANILEGSIRKQMNRIRVTVQLVEVEHGYNLWSERYDRDFDDIFAIQDEIALAITEKLKITLLQNEREQIEKLPTVNTEAYELYLKGRFYWGKRGRWLGLALENFSKAIQIDPKFAAAYAGVADAYSSLGMYGIIPPYDAMPKAKAAASKAVSIDPSLSDAFTSIAFINGFYENDRISANDNFRKALATNRNNATAHYWYSFYLSVVEKDLARAQEEGFAAIEVEPHNAISYYVTGLAFLAERNFPKALELAYKAIEIDPSLFLPYFLVGWCSILQEDFETAEKYLDLALNLSGRHSWPLGFMVYTKMQAGKKDQAIELMEEINERNKKEYFSVFGAAIGAIGVGDNQLAISYLEKGHKDKDTLLHIFAHYKALPVSLTSDPAFQAFMEKTGLVKHVNSVH
jgi:adenylate cyclase